MPRHPGKVKPGKTGLAKARSVANSNASRGLKQATKARNRTNQARANRANSTRVTRGPSPKGRNPKASQRRNSRSTRRGR